MESTATILAHPQIGKGLDIKMLGAGIALIAGGLGAAYVGLFTAHGVRIGPIPIPLSIVGPIIVLVGVIAAAMSFRQKKCLPCGKPLDIATAWFPPKQGNDVVAAIKAGDVAALEQIPFGFGNKSHTQVSLYYCESCIKTGTVDVSVFNNSKTELLKSHPLPPEIAESLIRFFVAREEAHEENQED